MLRKVGRQGDERGRSSVGNRLKEESVVGVMENCTDSSKLGEKTASFSVQGREYDL